MEAGLWEARIRYQFVKSTLQNYLATNPDIVYDFVVFNHSLYYFQPHDLVELHKKFPEAAILGVIHLFDKPKGSFMFPHDGKPGREAEWTTIDGKISMSTHGNPFPYVHPSPVWIANGGMDCGEHAVVTDCDPIFQGCGTFTVRVIVLEKREDQKLAQLPQVQDESIPIKGIEQRLPKRVFDDIMRIVLTKTDLKKGPSRNSVRRIVATQIKKNKTSSGFGPHVDRITELAMERFAASREENTKWYVKKGWLLEPSLNDNTGLLAVALVVAKSALLFVYKWRLLFSFLLTLTLLIMPGMAKASVFIVAVIFLAPIFLVLHPKMMITVCAMFLVLVFLCRCRVARAAEIDLIDVWDEMNVTRSSNGIPSDATYVGRDLHAVNTKYDVTKHDMCPTAQIRMYDNTTCQDNSEVKGLTCIGPLFKEAMPYSFGATPINVEVSAKTRACVRPPDGAIDPECDCDMCPYCCSWKEFAEVQAKHIPAEPLEPMTFEEWNNRFLSAGKKKTNQFNLDKVNLGGLHSDDFKYEGFVKREANVPGFTEDGTDELRPRMISATSQEWKVLTGPWMATLATWVKSYFHSLSHVWYVAGATAEDISNWVNRAMSGMTDPVYFWLDYSKYDATQKLKAMLAEINLFEAFGAATSIPYWEEVKKIKCFKKVYTKFLQYVVSGTRGSGENETSVGNSLLNITVFFMTMTRYSHYVKQPVDDLIVHFYTAVMGDDFIAVLDRAVIDVVIFESIYQQTVRDLGMTITSGWSANPIDADFLRMMFFPTQNGVRVGKFPGRNICKGGVIVHKHDFDDRGRAAILFSNLNSAIPTSAHVPFLRKYVSITMQYLLKEYEDLSIPKNYQKFTRTTDRGNVYSADEVTWDAFEGKYGLTESDEKEFSDYYAQSLENYGLFCLLSSPLLADLIAHE